MDYKERLKRRLDKQKLLQQTKKENIKMDFVKEEVSAPEVNAKPNNGGLAIFKKDKTYYLVDVLFNDDTFDIDKVKVLKTYESLMEVQDAFKIEASDRNFG